MKINNNNQPRYLLLSGLCRGSTVCPSSCPCDFQLSLRPPTSSSKPAVSHYDSVLGTSTLPEPGSRSSRNLRRESPCSDPGGQVSRSTSYDRSSVSDWGEGSAAATTDSVFVRDMEETFARTLSRLRKGEDWFFLKVVLRPRGRSKTTFH